MVKDFFRKIRGAKTSSTENFEYSKCNFSKKNWGQKVIYCGSSDSDVFIGVRAYDYRNILKKNIYSKCTHFYKKLRAQVAKNEETSGLDSG